MNKPLISVIIPAHNCATTIDTAILSILNQTYKNIEIIIVDDNSIDNTEEVTKKYTSNYNNVFYYKLPYKDINRFNKKGRNINAGYSARNYGLEKATGEWITFQDADDASLRNRIEIQLELALKYNVNHLCTEWQQYKHGLENTKLNIDNYIENLEDLMVDIDTIIKLAKKTKGIFLKLFPNLTSQIPLEYRQLRVVNKLFWGSLDSYPGSGNSPLFKREVIEKVQFRAFKDREWPSFTGRGADRDFNFKVAETFKNSIVFKIPLYLWRVERQNDINIK